jgi:glycosyltransferase involved in cell wall biosynthesis
MGTESLAIILAAFDEGPTIADVVQRCRRHAPPDTEIVVVDDGSRDGTGGEAARAGARVLRLGQNRGKGQALRHGIVHTSADLLLFLDADGQDAPEEIPRLLAAMGTGVDLVIGSRFLGRFEPGAITPLNRAGTLALTLALNLLFGARITDPIAGFRCVRRGAWKGELRAARYDIEVDLLLGVLAAGGKVVEVPVTRAPRRHGISHLKSFRDGTRILGRILARRFMGRQPAQPA